MSDFEAVMWVLGVCIAFITAIAMLDRWHSRHAWWRAERQARGIVFGRGGYQPRRRPGVPEGPPAKTPTGGSAGQRPVWPDAQRAVKQKPGRWLDVDSGTIFYDDPHFVPDYSAAMRAWKERR